MAGDSISTLTRDDYAGVLALNNANAEATNFLDLAALGELIEAASYARGIGAGKQGFLIAMDQDANHDSPNFQWFRCRHDRFLYVDRIVIAEEARGRGFARRLYEDLFAVGRRTGHALVGCEVNLDPPNPVSDAFHAALDFSEVGRSALDGGKKTVRYYERSLI